MIKLILLSSCLTVGGSIHAASGLIDWGNAANQTPFNEPVYQMFQSNGKKEVNLDASVESVFNPTDSQMGVLAGSSATISVSGVVVTDADASNDMVDEIAMKVNMDYSTGDNWGVEFGGGPVGPTGQNFGGSGMFYYTEGGPWAKSDGSITTTINFSNYTSGGVSNLEFGMFGINRQWGTGGMAGGLDGADIVSVSATDTAGNAIDISSFFTTAGTMSGTAEDAAFDMSGTTTVILDATVEPTQASNSDHQRSDGNATFDSGSQMIQTLTIKYEAISAGTSVSQSSSGFLVSDMNFQTVPEPSSFLLSFAGLAGLAFYRKRK